MVPLARPPESVPCWGKGSPRLNGVRARPLYSTGAPRAGCLSKDSLWGKGLTRHF